MKKIKIIKIKDKIIKHKYLITILGFIIWILFIDSNNLIQTIKYANKIRNLEQKIKLLNENLKDLKDKNKIFMSDNIEEIEKYARQELRMTAEDEDVFVVE